MLKMPKEQKELLVEKVQAYFEQERSEPIGQLAAEQLLDFMLQEIGPHVYNKAIADARQLLMERMASIEDELYSMEKPLVRR
ncbi:DUF2164 domain-containing protein [Paenibacillus turpanensis]|uniref:DUF2164 domain-containing protein n=1 Tax=Paenibacillus turpanensis TaxID=2689078 RepID=UPI003132C3C2